MTRAPALLSLLLALAGCATLDKDECRNANWTAIGLEDGAQGRGIERVGDHRRACAEHNVQPDLDRYTAGRNEGLKTFCTYDRGYRHGLNGNAYSGACPEPMQKDFLAGYGRGKEIHSLDKRLEEVNMEIRKTKSGLSEPGSSPRLRAMLAEKLDALSREAADLERQLARARSRR